MGLPVLVELAIVLSLSIILKNYLFENSEFAGWLKDRVVESLNRAKDSLNPQNLRLFTSSKELRPSHHGLPFSRADAKLTRFAIIETLITVCSRTHRRLHLPRTVSNKSLGKDFDFLQRYGNQS